MEISDRLTRLAMFYDKEAGRCAKGSAYLAACVMQTSALEAMLQGMCFLFPRDVKRSTAFQRKKFRRKRSKALDFTLNELVKIADELAWFPPKKVTWGKRNTLAGFVHELRNLRNYVHPGKWAPERPETLKFTKKVYGVALEIFDVTRSWLYHHITEDLRARLENEEA
jgi:hypothetical protein